MPPAQDFRREKLKSQVIDSILLFFFIETIAATGYSGSMVEKFFRGS